MSIVPTPTDKTEPPVEYLDRTVLYWFERPGDECSTLAIRDDQAAAALGLDEPDQRWFVPNAIGEPVYTWAGLLEWLSELELKLDDAARGRVGTPGGEA